MAAEDGRWDSLNHKNAEPFATKTDDFGGPEPLCTQPQGVPRMPTGDSFAPSVRDGGAIRPPVFVEGCNSFDHGGAPALFLDQGAPPTSPLMYNAQGAPTMSQMSHDSDPLQQSPISRLNANKYEAPATTPHSGITPTPFGGVRTSDFGDDVSARADWHLGSVVEVFSSSQQRWFVGCVVQDDGKNILTVQFEDGSTELKQKSLTRNDTNLATFGSKSGQPTPLPAAFTAVPSQTRAGQFSYVDSLTGVRYGNAELAWQVHFERTIFGASAPPSQTVHGIKPGKAGAAAASVMAESPHVHSSATGMSHDPVSPPRAQPMRISDLSPQAQASMPLPPMKTTPDYSHLEAQSHHTPYSNGAMVDSGVPIELPSFSTPASASNQSAYLQAHQVENHYDVGLQPARRPAGTGQDMYEWNQDPFYEWRAGHGAPAFNARAEQHQALAPPTAAPSYAGQHQPTAPYGGASSMPLQPYNQMASIPQQDMYNPAAQMGYAAVQQPARSPASGNMGMRPQAAQSHASSGPERLWTGPPPSVGH
eukprot:gnl/MRDRNA2_/MRDRNA2_160684_c0_seq1.p1 gnl/MRDRNA2_/MRDRNA2_160684_c0~~gnl/MRDRNA2_/MRDRNA2_160684_c0_seq1.p1  ORF type:complete len:599 (+),score=91.37 gnl/MRDRNA2_/MRDRNA2_160684_c0_seq1:198-1799(+)